MQKIRVGFYSQDSTLQTLLSSAMSADFQFFLASDQCGINRLLSTDSCHVVIVDLGSSDIPSTESLECARDLIAMNISCVILADIGLRSTATEFVRQGAHGYCHRPPSIRDLRTMLRKAYEVSFLRQHLNVANRPLEITKDCDWMIGRSIPMQHVYELVHWVANINASVLVTGESGTGKELVARAIHNMGCRSNRPFVAVACGAIPETLIEAELFGHEKGAFTGTAGSREGYLEQAGDGSLFLDEIGDLSLYTQVKLLRVLQQREFSRLGSSKLIPLRARLIFATHQDLAELVTQGKFRQDLYYRINVMGIEVPSLQERAEDISQIASRFLRHYSQIYQKEIQDIEPQALALLQKYPWPGNVRELENVIQRAIIVSRGSCLQVADLPLDIRDKGTSDINASSTIGSFERQLRAYKVRLATTAIRDHKGNKTSAARSLNISRAYLHRLIQLEESPILVLLKNEAPCALDECVGQ